MMARLKTWLNRLTANPKYASLWQFVKFGLVGASNTLISLAVYWLCLYVFRWHYQISNAVSFLVSVVNAYYWNGRFVFKTSGGFTLGQHARAFTKALASYGSTFLLNAALLSLCVEALHISTGLAPIVCMLVTIPLNFVLNKYWAFRTKGRKADPTDDAQKPAG
ncbi:MAG TPA: GtrA family protein [Candidatus Limiplasma sp.]|nr:GtrA family protein [Candidatus Limiplasma sp.]HPS81643.1 GtrA family protein [Candidatus Limiplasma sp.]